MNATGYGPGERRPLTIRKHKSADHRLLALPQRPHRPQPHSKMTDRHIFNDHTSLVVRSLRGLVATHPYLSLIPSLKIVYRADHDPSNVALICGGGSGHEPGTVGFVGKGLLSASVAGDVFASPSARQVFAGIKAVPSDKGTILIITNCTVAVTWGCEALTRRYGGQPPFRAGETDGSIPGSHEC